MLDMSQAIAPVMHDIDSAGVKNQMIITANNQTSKVTFTWDAADFGVKTQVDYSVEVALGDGPKKVIVSGITKTEASNTYEAINQVLFNGLGLKENELTDVNFYVGATVGAAQTLYSEPVVVKASVTAAEKQYPKIYVVGEFNGWKHDKASFLFDFIGDDAMYQGLIDFGKAERKDGGFKITPKNNWDAEWGMDADQEAEADETVLLTSGGVNINIYQLYRFYHFSLDKATGTLTKNKVFNTVGMIGTAVGGWDADIDMEFDATTQKFWADVTLTAGELKFRADDDWAINWGVATEGKEMTKGVLDGDKNITVPAGNYRVYLNLNNLAEPSFVLDADKYGAEVEVTPGAPELSGQTKTLYFIPGTWAGEGITYAAWIWPTDGNGSWYDVTDEDGDGVYDVTFPVEYTNIIFASMKGETSWDNKVNQTPDMVVPTDSSNAYDATSSAWVVYNAESGSADRVLYFKPNAAWSADGVTFAAWAWATDTNGSWYAMADSDADGLYEVTIPSGIDNIIFASMKGETSWDNKVNQTADLKVPTDGKNIYDVASGAWVASADETPETPDVPEGAVPSEWGLIGSFAVCNSWSTNITLYVDGDYSVAKGVVFASGDQFKFRKGTSWGVELTYQGVVSVDAKMELEDGAGGKQNSSINVAGTYDVFLANDLSAFYVMTPGKTPADAGAAQKQYIDPSASTFVVGMSGTAIGWDDPSFSGNDRATFVSKTVTNETTFAGTYEFKLEGFNVNSGDEFKVRINGQWIGVGGATVEGLQVGGTDNFVSNEAGTYTVTISFEWDGSTHSSVKAVFAK